MIKLTDVIDGKDRNLRWTDGPDRESRAPEMDEKNAL